MPTPQTPPVHTAEPFAGAGHTLLHAPQLASELEVLVSHPLPTLPSQLPNPGLHPPTAQTPNAHAAAPFAGEAHRLPHAPQFAEELSVSISHPFARFPSQLPKPRLQAPTPQTPALQEAEALGDEGHTLPQRPQFAPSAFVLSSHPLPACWSQLP